ncbi:MAG: type I restriction enzyme HsdR N-terminal domain-containing protein [Saprospiraceae bacterium]|nr:type I restriction enzyme HsdR N-terminal domain-containing protein [Saprospiraceae bacterium]
MVVIDLLKYKEKLTFKYQNDKNFIKDPIRKRFIVLQPEELVRQLFIQYLLSESHFHRNLIQVEKTIIMNGMKRRFDIVVYDKNLSPYILIECKSPEVTLSQQSFDQIFRYNMVVAAPFLVVTNGIITYCGTLNKTKDGYKFINEIPMRVME